MNITPKKIILALLCVFTLVSTFGCKSEETVDSKQNDDIKQEETEEKIPDETAAQETFKAFCDSLAAFNFDAAGKYTDDSKYFESFGISDEKTYVSNFRLLNSDGSAIESISEKMDEYCELNEYKLEVKQLSLNKEDEKNIKIETEITYTDISPMAVYRRKAQEIILCDFYTMCVLMEKGIVKEGMNKEQVLSAVDDSVNEKAIELAVSDIETATDVCVLKTFELTVKNGEWVIKSDVLKELQSEHGVELDEDYYADVQAFIDSYKRRTEDVKEASGTVKETFDALLELRLLDSEKNFKEGVSLFDSMGINSVEQAADLTAKEVAAEAVAEISKKGLEVSEECVYEPVNKKVTGVINKLLAESEYRVTDSKMLENGNVEFSVFVKMPDFDKISALVSEIDIKKLVGENLSSLTNVSGYIGALVGAVGMGKDPVESMVSTVAGDLCDSVAKEIMALDLQSRNYDVQLEKINGKWIVCGVATK